MLTRLFYILFILIFDLNVNANPTPLGFELNKAVISDVEKVYHITKKEQNHWEGYNYYVNVRDVKLEGLTKLLIICNDDNIIQAVILTIDKSKFTEFYQLLSEKYKLTYSQNPKLGDKEIKFADSDCTIILDAPHLSFSMYLIYITDEFLTKFKGKQKEEENLKKTRDKELL
ncbi:MAG: hypothetical protein LF885_03985 [Rickettsia endosymbiont of Culicoides impunctatus]|nr:MAG: hypothetical protein LF885_03985 [Rickettsia endosymbiont of Culicoides impunctatus]